MFEIEDEVKTSKLARAEDMTTNLVERLFGRDTTLVLWKR
jgi:hypothetical protein